MNKEFIERIDKAIKGLSEISVKYSKTDVQMFESEILRINGKIEGLKLAKSYYLEMEKES